MSDDFKDRAKDELRSVGKQAANEAGRALVTAFIDWVKSRPIKRLIARRRAEKAKKR